MRCVDRLYSVIAIILPHLIGINDVITMKYVDGASAEGKYSKSI